MKIARFYTMQYLQLTYVHTQVRYKQDTRKAGNYSFVLIIDR